MARVNFIFGEMCKRSYKGGGKRDYAELLSNEKEVK
jgi:hypothetical protein